MTTEEALRNVHPDHLESFLEAMSTRKKVLPLLHREQETLKNLGFPTAAFSSIATGINLPGEGQSDIDLVIRSGTKDLSHISKQLESKGIPYRETIHGYNVHSYKTPEGIDVEVKVFQPHVFDYQKKGFQTILGLPEHKKAEIIHNKRVLKPDAKAYKKYKDDVYLHYGVHAPNDVYPETMDKEAGLSDSASKIIAMTPVVLGAGLVLYDLHKSRGYSEDRQYVSDTIEGKKDHKLVNLTSYAKSNFPGVKVIDTPEKFQEFLKKETKIAESLPKDTLRDVSKNMFEDLTHGNAAAASGAGGYYLIAGDRKIPQDVLEHELGHLRDFKENKIRTTDGSYNKYVTGFFNSMAQAWFKSKYMSGKYMQEVTAWDKAKKSKTTDEIRKRALGTYEKSWHQGRALNSALLTLLYTNALYGAGARGAAATQQNYFEKFAKAVTNKEKAERHHSSGGKDWQDFERNLPSKGFQKEILKHQLTDEKLREYTKNYGGYVSSRKVVAKVPSRTSDRSYEIRKLPGGRLGCGCKDWQYSHSWKGTDCAHIASIAKEKKSEVMKLIPPAYIAAQALKDKEEGDEVEDYVKRLSPPERGQLKEISTLIAKHFI